MKTVLHKADSRGHANHGWLDTHHTFSFANYYDPSRVHFGALRVLNDDYIAPSNGFDRHPHDNMEICTIILEGTLTHGDDMGHTMELRANDVQVMSAGTGIFHSEYNHDLSAPVRLLQIWILPEKKNIKPRYDQKTFEPEARKNAWQQIVSPDEKEALWLNQNTWFSRITLDSGNTVDYSVHNPANGCYLFMIEGTAGVGNINLGRRDGLGISESDSITILAKENSEILLMEVPMLV